MADFEPRSPRDLFDALADEYDEMRRDLGWDPFPHLERALDGRPLDGLRVLDIGCGTGEVAQWLTERGASVRGVDISAQMCLAAAQRVPAATFSTADLSEGLPTFADDSFDLVLALGCLEYVDDIGAALGELVRVTRPGGTVLTVIELCGPDRPDGVAHTVQFLDEWQRRRLALDEVHALVGRLFAPPGHADIDEVPGYVLEDSGERVHYARVIGRPA